MCVCVPLNNVGIVKEQQQGEEMQIDVDVSLLLVILKTERNKNEKMYSHIRVHACI